MIALPALPIRASSAVEDDATGLDELLDLCADEEPPAPPQPVLWAVRARTHAYTQTWRQALTEKGVALGGPRRAW